MDAVKEAMKALKQVALKGKKEKELVDKVDSLTTTLRLLVFTFERIHDARLNLMCRILPSVLTPKFLESSLWPLGNP